MEIIPRRLSLELKNHLLIVDYEKQGKWRRRKMPCRHPDEYTASQLVAILKEHHRPLLDTIAEDQLLRFVQAIQTHKLPERRILNISSDSQLSPSNQSDGQAPDQDISYLLDPSEKEDEAQDEKVTKHQESDYEEDAETSDPGEEFIEEEVASEIVEEEELAPEKPVENSDDKTSQLSQDQTKGSELTTLIPLMPVPMTKERNQSTGSIDRLLDGFGAGETDDESEKNEQKNENIHEVSVHHDAEHTNQPAMDFGIGDTDSEKEKEDEAAAVEYEEEDFEPMSEEIHFSDNGLDALSDGKKNDDDDAF